MTTTNRLDAARAALREVHEQIASLDAERARVASAAEPASAATSTAASLKQQRTGLLARMLRLGRVDQREPDVERLSREIVTAEAAAGQAAAVLEARDHVLADLSAQITERHQRLPALQRELAEAQLEAATTEINSELVPQLRAAAGELGAIYGKLLGAGMAHVQLSQEARERHGIAVSSLGNAFPHTRIVLNPVGFGIEDGGNYNTLLIEMRPAAEAAHADALRRWRA